MASPSASAKTVVFKTFRNTDGSDTDIAADVYLPSGGELGTPLLPVFWVHTGGLLQGTRKFIPPHLVRGVDKHRVALIAPDFRLCPQVTISEVLDDVRDCINFFLDADKLAQHLGAAANDVDTARYVLGGSSAGGWISLLLGLSLVEQADSLRTKASSVFSIYPITTLERDMAPFYYQAQRPVSWSVDGKPIDGRQLEEQGCLTRCHPGSDDGKQALIKTEAPPAADPVRAQMYNYARQEGNFASLVLGSPDDVERFSVPHLIRRRWAGAREQGGGERVAVMVVYGDGDAKVPHSQSEHVIDALEEVGYRRGADLEVEVKQGGDHLYDMEEQEEVPGLWPFIILPRRRGVQQ
ncbi:uncharacterized protein PFL1_00278 [Pseudozyma flocculosa PF-1]|uniref:Alpha/beta hydrolase fold-3 domain-containing protein n=1 Tax=Pseudozyma flocculosa TaxID=84751 RepID=A0A5C3ET12_9BASI|nr:uncharacterized protein PFL1_00278 [Pseudozyma flocculosa PF-1]EPQ32080.1 hypothetical protein PFL1_00278 [Pseudozyma flocculosa PF-1]SPO34990.1 uncharacterized protein PSFLO_00461 [Pseudozyma flocculosa]